MTFHPRICFSTFLVTCTILFSSSLLYAQVTAPKVAPGQAVPVTQEAKKQLMKPGSVKQTPDVVPSQPGKAALPKNTKPMQGSRSGPAALKNKADVAGQTGPAGAVGPAGSVGAGPAGAVGPAGNKGPDPKKVVKGVVAPAAGGAVVKKRVKTKQEN